MPYRMTRGTVSVIRLTEKDVQEAQAAGFVMDGACDADGNLTGAAEFPTMSAPVETPAPIASQPKAKGAKRGA